MFVPPLESPASAYSSTASVAAPPVHATALTPIRSVKPRPAKSASVCAVPLRRTMPFTGITRPYLPSFTTAVPPRYDCSSGRRYSKVKHSLVTVTDTTELDRSALSVATADNVFDPHVRFTLLEVAHVPVAGL